MPQATVTGLLVAGLAQWECFGVSYVTDFRKSLLCVLGESHTSHVKSFLKKFLL